MFEKKVLDGFVRLLNISGAVRRTDAMEHSFKDFDDNYYARVNMLRDFDSDDIDPALVARTSFAKGLEEHTTEQDEALVEYLMRNNHSSPFEFTTVYMELKLPIFVARQIMRHRSCTFNEVSGRYVTLPKDWYIPEVVRGKSSDGNKQGSEDNLSENIQGIFKEELEKQCKASYERYENFINQGVCLEQARMFLHLNHYTSFVWKQDLHNLMHFLSLRLDEHAQWEVRQYAEAIYSLLTEHLPRSMVWFDTYRRKLDVIDKQDLKELLTIFKGGTPREGQELDTLRYIALLEKLAKRQGLKL